MNEQTEQTMPKVNDLVKHISSVWVGRVWSVDPELEFGVYVMFNASQGFGECYTFAEFADKFEEA